MKFPVFKAFGATLAYLGRHGLDLFKAMWAPALLLMAAMAYAMPQYMETAMTFSEIEPGAGVPSLPPEFFRSMGVIFGASMLFFPMLMAASLRHLVRGDTLKAPFYLSFGGDEIRLIAAYVLFFLMFFAVYIVFILGILVVAFALSLVSKGLAGVVTAIGAVGGLGAFLWFLLRLSLIFPATMATRKIGIAESWHATKGNSLRLFCFWMLAGILVLAIAAVYFAFAMSGVIGMYAEIIEAGADAAAQEEIQRRIFEIQRDLYDYSKPMFWPFIIGTYFYTIASTAVMNVAAGTAWRYLTDGGPGRKASVQAMAA